MKYHAAGRTHKGELDAINEQHHILDVRASNIKTEWIKSSHPLAIGDAVTVNDMFTHTGKTMRVFYRGVSSRYGDDWTWQATGYIVKKDGTVGRQQGKWSRPVVEREY